MLAMTKKCTKMTHDIKKIIMDEDMMATRLHKKAWKVNTQR
jgi:hypothetical protein